MKKYFLGFLCVVSATGFVADTQSNETWEDFFAELSRRLPPLPDDMNSFSHNIENLPTHFERIYMCPVSNCDFGGPLHLMHEHYAIVHNGTPADSN